MNRTLFLLLLLFLIPACLLAQPDVPAVPMKELLRAIEKKHGVHFAYLDDDITKIKLAAPPPEWTLQQKIDYLSQLSGLAFAFSDATHLYVSKKRPEPAILPDDALTQQLEEVIVRQYLARGISKNADASLRVRPQEFGLLPGLTEAELLQTMQQLPGILSVDEIVSSINVRGGTHDQNLFSWNGIRMFQTGHFFGLVSAFSPSVPQNIQIFKNGSPAFLNEGVSSSVAIETYPADSTHAGIFSNLISAEAYGSFKLSRSAGITVSARRSVTDLFESPTYKEYADRIFQNTVVTDLQSNQTVHYGVAKTFRFYDFSLRYDQRIGKRNSFSLSAIGMFDNLDVLQSRRDSLAFTERKNSALQQRSYGSDLEWKTVWNPRWNTTVSGYFSYYDLSSSNRSIANDQQIDQRNTVLDTGLRLSNLHQLSPQLTFEDGYQYNETGILNRDVVNTPEFRRETKTVLRNHALIAQLRYRSADGKLRLQPGLRLNYFDRFGSFRLEPRWQSSYRLSEKVQIEALAEWKSQTASQVVDLQQDFLGLEKRRWMPSDNHSVPIQKSVQASVGITYNSDGWLLTADGFRKKVRGLPSASQSFQNQLEFVRINGDYSVWGVELLAQKQFGGGFRSWLSYSFNRNEYTFDGFAPPNFANNFEIVHAVLAAVGYEGKRLKASLGARWYTGKPETTPLGGQDGPIFGQIDYHDPNNANLNDYFQANFSACYAWRLSARSALTAGFSVLNLFDSRNIINRYYRVNAAHTIERVNTYSLGRTPNVSLRINF